MLRSGGNIVRQLFPHYYEADAKVVPMLQPLDMAHSPLAVQALIVCAVIAASKHSLLPTTSERLDYPEFVIY